MSSTIVAIDARVLSQTGKGVSRFLYETLRVLAQRRDLTLILFSNRPLHPDNVLPVETVIDATWGRVPGSIWMIARLNRLAMRARADVLWGPSHVLPMRRRGLRTVLTVHDMVHRIMPGSMGAWNRFISYRLVDPSIRRADRIVSVSETTRRDMIALLGLERKKIDVVRLGVRPMPAAIPTPTTKSDGYLFMLGSIEPRKNVGGMLRCFTSLRRILPGLSLRLTGAHSWNADDTLQQINNDSHCDLLGFLSDDEIVTQMAGARAFVMPSHYEGFGLPIVEAVGLAPIIVSDIAIFRELAEVIEGIHFVDFGDPDAAARSIAAFLASRPVPARFRSGATTELSWKTVAARYADILTEHD